MRWKRDVKTRQSKLNEIALISLISEIRSQCFEIEEEGHLKTMKRNMSLKNQGLRSSSASGCLCTVFGGHDK